MDEGLKNRAYLEGMRLKKAGYDNEVIRARLDKQGIPDDLIQQVLMNLYIQQKVDIVKEEKPFFNIALLKIGIGVFLAIVSAVIFPDRIYIPIGLIVSGIVYALISNSKMKG